MSLDYRKVFEKGPGLFLLLTPKLIIEAASDGFLRATLSRREEVVGRLLFDVLPDNPEDASATGVANLRASLERVLRDRVADTMGFQRHDISPTGAPGSYEERYWAAVNTPILDEKGDVELIIHAVTDVTPYIAGKKARSPESRELSMGSGRVEAELFQHVQDLRAVNQGLKRERTEADAVTQARTRFFANVSHELRTPLTLILGPVRRLLREGGLSDQARASLETVERNAEVLLGFVNEILDVSRLQLGKSSIVYSDADLAGIVKVVAGHFDSLAAEKNVRYAVEAPESLHAQFDVEKVARILANFLGNAFRFAPQNGKVACRLSRSGDNAVVRVQDNGPGVPADVRQSIFEPFCAVAPLSGGTGLGLSIAKEFAELHGGRVSVDDAPGGGALFTVELPLEAPAGASIHAPGTVPEGAAATFALAAAAKPSEDVEPASTASPDAPRILVVEDNPEMRRFIAQTLKDYRVETAVNGEEGLAKALKAPPDLILTDIMMPVMDGLRMIELVRGREELGFIPIIVLSARTDERLRAQLLRSSVQDYVIKPFSVEELTARVSIQIRLKRFNDLLEKEVAERTAELTASNKELDAFCSSIAHDLRTPLRGVVSFAQILTRRLAGSLDPESAALFARIEASGSWMARLIDALLLLARVTRQPMRRDRVDLSALASALAEEHRLASKEPNAEFVVADGLAADGDPELLRLLLSHLLDNAWKFAAKTPRPRVEVGREPGGAFYVRDNGAGFDMAHAGKLFGVFQRLHSYEEFSGTGIGLATVKRIVERHGGRVWAESAPGKGAVFFFALP